MSPLIAVASGFMVSKSTSPTKRLGLPNSPIDASARLSYHLVNHKCAGVSMLRRC